MQSRNEERGPDASPDHHDKGHHSGGKGFGNSVSVADWPNLRLLVLMVTMQNQMESSHSLTVSIPVISVRGLDITSHYKPLESPDEEGKEEERHQERLDHEAAGVAHHVTLDGKDVVVGVVLGVAEDAPA